MDPVIAEPAGRDRGLRSALLLLLAGAFLRCPAILMHGRVWAEESSVFLVGAWSRSFAAELVKAEFGYYSLWDNFFAALAAHRAMLPWDALLFTWSAVGLLLVTGYFIYRAEFLPTRLAKTCGVMVLLLTPGNIESWLNLINSEFYFGIVAAVILCSDASRLRLTRALMLGLAVLSGPLTTLLAPFFVVRAAITRRRGEVVQAGIVCAGALAQIAVSLTTSTANRKVHLDPLHLGPELFNKQVVFLFLDRDIADQSAQFMAGQMHFNLPALLLSWTLFLAAAAAGFYLLRHQRIALWLLATGLYLAVLEDLLALDGRLKHVAPGDGERYTFTPNFLIELALLAAAFTLARHWQRTATRVLVVLALVCGLRDYFSLPFDYQTVYRGEPFRQQALRWQHDPSVALHGSPESWPAFHLPAETK